MQRFSEVDYLYYISIQILFTCFCKILSDFLRTLSIRCAISNFSKKSLVFDNFIDLSVFCAILFFYEILLSLKCILQSGKVCHKMVYISLFTIFQRPSEFNNLLSYSHKAYSKNLSPLCVISTNEHFSHRALYIYFPIALKLRYKLLLYEYSRMYRRDYSPRY